MDQETWSNKGGNVPVEGDIPSGDIEVWAGPLMSGQFAVILLNRSTEPADITAKFADCGLREGEVAAVRDIWAHKDIGTFTNEYTGEKVPGHGVKFLILTPILN